VCLGELEVVPDAVTVARKVLSAVARVGQRFGASHVVNVLRGRSTDLVAARGHAALSVFGLFAGVQTGEVRGYIDQLIGLGFLRHTDETYPVLRLTPPGLALLRDSQAAPDLQLARQRRPEASSPDPSSGRAWAGVDRALFDRLRALRLQIARERGVPPYVVFHDATLRELARVRPTSLGVLQTIYGIGARKADDLGPRVLQTINSSAVSG
jgi:ATP-dependent DNA helicase RecQ